MTAPPPSLAWLREQPGVLRWLDLEQTVNERLFHPRVFASIDASQNGVRPDLRASARAAWRLDACWVPRREVRCWADVDGALEKDLGLAPRRDRVPIFLHPQGTGLFRGVVAKHGREPTDIWVTPTSSERSLLACRPDAPRPCVIKVSLGVVIGKRRRVVRERDLARALVLSRVLDLVPADARAALGLETFPERAGVTVGGRGWLLRGLPPTLQTTTGAETLVPLFSLVSRRGDAPSIVELAARHAGGDPVAFAVASIVEPYVQALAYLLFDQGIVLEAHAQNVALPLGPGGAIGRRVILRDLGDASVHLGLRLARGHALPDVRDLVAEGAPFSPLDESVRPYASGAARPGSAAWKRLRHRAEIAVVRYGMYGVVWTLHRALARTFPTISRARLYGAYLALWQRACAHWLGVVPTRRGAHGLELDAAIAAYLETVDWRALGAGGPRAMPRAAGRLPSDRRARPGARYREIACAWGRLGVDERGGPAYFVARDA